MTENLRLWPKINRRLSWPVTFRTIGGLLDDANAIFDHW